MALEVKKTSRRWRAFTDGRPALEQPAISIIWNGQNIASSGMMDRPPRAASNAPRFLSGYAWRDWLRGCVPRRKTVALDRRDPQNSNRDMWTYDLARGVESRFSFGPKSAADFHPVWSPVIGLHDRPRAS